MKIGILGAGSIGQRHARNLVTLGHTDLVFCDSENREIQSKGKFVASLPELIKESPQLVLVCTPTSLHKEHLCSLVESKIPNIFIEKPLSHTMEGLQEIGKEIFRNKIRTMTGCNFRFHPCVREIKRIIESGCLGKLFSARIEAGQYLPDWLPQLDYRGRYSSKTALGGGCLLDYIHELDYSNWLFGSPLEVGAYTKKVSTLDIETEDSAELLVKYDNDMVASIHVDYLQRHYRRYCRVSGELGSAEWEFNSKSVKTYLAGKAEETTLTLPQDFDFNSIYLSELKYFIGCIEDNTPNMSDFSEGLSAVQLASTAKRSSETRKFEKIERTTYER